MPPPPPRPPVTPANPDAPQLQMATNVSRHAMLVKAFDHLNNLEVNGMDNDYLHEQLMEGVMKAIGPYVGTPVSEDTGAHVYLSTPELVTAGIVNLKSCQEIILTIYRKNKKSLIYKKRILKRKPPCAAHATSPLKLLSEVAGSCSSAKE